ncbi:MAG: adenosylmethionine--8-amino-7-oxononanoate transaminase [Deltaproteobacteria bacterium]|nr:adenosylmethionine--8-amino-7-oxononanoate transaminase [Deltaproteobacteria bacterium]
MKRRTRTLIDLDRNHVWHPFTQMKEWRAEDPIIIERGRGNYLIDTEGKKYLDGVSSLWANVHGHRKREIDRAVKGQLGKVAHSTLLGLGNVPSIELARRLTAIAPRGLTKVFYSDDGSTAVEIALKMAFQYWEQTKKKNTKKKFIAFTGAYHGDTFGSMSVGEIDIFVRKYRPLLFETLRAPYPYCYRCTLKMSYPGCKTACLGVFEEMLRERRGETAACVIEPGFEGAAGMISAPPGFLKGVRRLTRRYGVLMIADEVAAGFGRTGHMFACDAEGVSPDLLCLAKGLTGGYLPLAATLATDRIYRAFLGKHDEFKAFFHGHTYTGNPLGCVAAIANLDVFERERTLDALKGRISLLKELLNGLADLPRVGDIRQTGLVAGIELVKDRATKEPYPANERVGHRVCMEARKSGLMIRPLGDTVVLMPPLSIKEKELEKMVRITRGCIERLTR